MDWDALDAGKYRAEREATAGLLTAPPLPEADREIVLREALELARAARATARRQGAVEGFLQEFSLNTQEGLALMCLAEALLRTPDGRTRDTLIAEKIGPADWAGHLGQSDSLFVNASTWGLMLTGRLLDIDREMGAARQDPRGFLQLLAHRLGEPLIRAAVAAAIRIMGEQFVLGRDIEVALRRAGKEGFLCSFDMLGEGARTAAEAQRYEDSYAAAIETVGRRSGQAGPEKGHGVSVKLSALSPRFEATQEVRIWRELYPRLGRLAAIAARHDINFTLDAEEADRLVISLKLLDRLAREPGLGGWTGLGLAVQAYQKRAPEVIAGLARLARDSGRRLMVRLVKGAYWDSEIKRAQIAGRPDYPVFTRKASTDLSYLVAARALIDAAPHLYAQFATHNAQSLAAVRHMAAGSGVAVEYQRLHGMGEALYRAADERYGGMVLRAYAPVGGHADLLPYLVRRLLENGANTSFVGALLDPRIPVENLVSDPFDAVAAEPGPHDRIAAPRLIHADRLGASGADLSSAADRARLRAGLEALDENPVFSGPIVSGTPSGKGEGAAVRSPAEHGRIVGHVVDSTAADVDAAFRAARAAQPEWDKRGGAGRARVLREIATAIEAAFERLAALCVREAGKTWADAIAEIREAVDFLRYYAVLAERQFAAPRVLVGPAGERNTLALRGRGVFACISPWNFPLAIFTGQVAAALAAGNAVLAKPAEQTPLIAAEVVRIFHGAGLDSDLLHLLPGPGPAIGAALIGHPHLAGVAFTGGTETAWAINRGLAARGGPILPFIAETGGLNALFVDTTALREQVIDDVIVSAFGSAGQRCSALRLLFLPADTAAPILAGIKGAMDALAIGDPARFCSDIGPVIDRRAQTALAAYVGMLEGRGQVVHRLAAPGGEASFFGPTLAEIALDGIPDREIFGPVLHVLRYEPGQLERACTAVAAKGYGLTLGVHSRIEGFARRVQALIPAGNVYVNRSIIGAAVGVQPFGGEGLSGTGPKAGGPHALLRFAVERAVSVNIAAQGGDAALLNL